MKTREWLFLLVLGFFSLSSCGQALSATGGLELSWSDLPRVFVVPLSSKFNDDLLLYSKDRADRSNYCEMFYLTAAKGPVASEYDQEVSFHWELLKYAKIVSEPSEADLFYVPYYFSRRAFHCMSRENLGTFHADFAREIEPWLHRYSDPKLEPRFFMASGEVCSCGTDPHERQKIGMDMSKCNPFFNNAIDNKNKHLGNFIRPLAWEQVPRGLLDTIPKNTIMPYLAIQPLPHHATEEESSKTNFSFSFAVVQPTRRNPESDREILVLDTAAAFNARRQCVHCGDCDGFDDNGVCPVGCGGIRDQLSKLLLQHPDKAQLSRGRQKGHSSAHIKENATFCLEPAGDTLTRRSFYEVIVLGCVPVVFREDQAFLSQLAFSDYVPYKDIWVSLPLERVANMDLDVVEVLQKISPEALRTKRRLMQTWAHVFVYDPPTTKPQAPEPINTDTSPPQGALFHVLADVFRTSKLTTHRGNSSIAPRQFLA